MKVHLEKKRRNNEINEQAACGKTDYVTERSTSAIYLSSCSSRLLSGHTDFSDFDAGPMEAKEDPRVQSCYADQRRLLANGIQRFVWLIGMETILSSLKMHFSYILSNYYMRDNIIQFLKKEFRSEKRSTVHILKPKRHILRKDFIPSSDHGLDFMTNAQQNLSKK